MSFLEQNLHHITETLQNTLYVEHITKLPGLIQHLDPRTRIICFCLLLMSVNLSKNIVFILSVYVFLLLLAYASQIPLKFFIMRVWMFLPFFTGIIALPAIFNVFTPGNALLTLINLPNYHLYISITQNGVFSAAYLLTRVATSVSSAILLVLTTDWIQLLKSLERLHVPKMFIIVSLITYRYIFVLLKTTNNMLLSRKSRMIGKPQNQTHRWWIGGTLGTLFNKTQTLSEDVYKAMRSRGYANQIIILSDFHYQFVDYVAIGVTFTLIVMLYFIWN